MGLHGVNTAGRIEGACRVQGRSLALLASVDWTPVIVALITLAGVIFSALCTVYVAMLIRTPSKRSIGDQVEGAHHIAISNRMLLARMAKQMGIAADDPEVRAILRDYDND